MKHLIYKVTFWATKTLQNGKERRTLKAVYMPRFDEDGKHIDEAKRIERGIAALKAEHYYKIEYGSTIATEIISA